MIFNGIEKEYLTVVRGRKRPAWAPVNRHLISVTGMTGAHLSQTDTQVRVISVPVFLMAENIGDLQKVKEDLAEWLIHDEPKELVFKDEPDRIYYAVVDGELDLDELVRWGQGIITFICPDPYKYGHEKSLTIPDNAIINNEGTADADPIFTLDVQEPTTFAMVSNGEEYMMVGRPVDVDEIPTEKYESVFSTNASSLVGWSTIPSGSTIDEGVVGGNMAVHGGYAFYAETFGTNPNGWVGPAVKRSLIRPVQDFRMTMDMALFNRQGNVGKIVVSLLDESDNVIASVQMVDATNSAWRNRAIIRVGTANQGYDLINHAPERGGWNDFRGVLRIERIGNEFKAYVANVTDGRHHGRLNSQPYYDRLGEYSAKVAQVRVYIAKARHYEPFPMYFHGGNVWEIHDLDASQIEYIADEGDRIVFDHKTGDCYINGEPVPFDFGADFFKLKKGVNNLAVLPEDTFDVSIKYRERYK